MIIKEIELENIRSHRKTVVRFPKGTVLFEGDIGSGKTSILMAIEFALFGNSTSNFYQNLLRKGATEGHVRIKFEVGGEDYEIYRSLEKKGKRISNNESYVLTPQGKKMLTSEEIRTYVLNLIGLNVSTKKRKSLPIVTYAIYTPQETMKSILEGKDEERLEVIRKIFKLDEYRVARDNVDIVVDSLERELDKVSFWNEEIERIEGEIKDAEDYIDERKKPLEELEKKKEELEKKRDELERALEGMEEKRGRYEKLREKLIEISSHIESAEKNLERMKEEMKDIESSEKELLQIEGQAKEYERVKKESEELEEKIKELGALENQLARVEGEIKNLSQEIERAEKHLMRKRDIEKRIEEMKKEKEKYGDIEKKISELDEMLNALNVALKRNEEKIEEKEKAIRELEKSGAKCPTCMRPLSEEKKREIIEKAEKEIEDHKNNIKSLRAKISKIKEEKREKENEEKRGRELEISIAKLMQEREEMEKRELEKEEKEKSVEELEEKREEIGKKVDELKPFMEKYEENKRRMRELEKFFIRYMKLKSSVERKSSVESRMKSLEKELNEKKEEREKIKEELEKIGYDEEEHEKERKKLSEVREEHAKVRERIRGIHEEIKRKEEEINVKREKVKELRDKIEEGKKKGDMVNWLYEKFKPALEDIEKMRLSVINEEFRMLFEEWFHELLGESDYDATIDENFKPIIRYEKYDMPLGTLSGGERTSVALAYRLALNTMVKKALGLKSNLLILDEPTDGFSKDQLYKVKDILEKMDTDQIIIVSHEKELRNLADEIFVVEKENGVSKISEIK